MNDNYALTYAGLLYALRETFESSEEPPILDAIRAILYNSGIEIEKSVKLPEVWKNHGKYTMWYSL